MEPEPSTRVSGTIDRVIEELPRWRFVPEPERIRADEDSPLPIGYGQTISQPSLVAFMTELLEVGRGDRVLEIGTGSGFQATVLARLGVTVYSIEVVSALHERARDLLAELAPGVHLRVGDGHVGWPEAAPFDATILTCATTRISDAIWGQLAVGGRLVAPIGSPNELQMLVRRRKNADGGYTEEAVTPVRFVPMTGTGLA